MWPQVCFREQKRHRCRPPVVGIRLARQDPWRIGLANLRPQRLEEETADVLGIGGLVGFAIEQVSHQILNVVVTFSLIGAQDGGVIATIGPPMEQAVKFHAPPELSHVPPIVTPGMGHGPGPPPNMFRPMIAAPMFSRDSSTIRVLSFSSPPSLSWTSRQAASEVTQS